MISGTNPELNALKSSGSGPTEVPPTQQRLAQATKNQHARQGHDETRYSVVGDPVALCCAYRRADDETKD